MRSTFRIPRNALTSSTCLVVKGSPYFCFARSSLEGGSSSQYVKALRLKGTFVFVGKLDDPS